MDRSFEHKLRNFLHSALLILGMTAIAAAAVALIWGGEAAPWALAGVALGALIAPGASKQLALSLYGAKPLTARDFPFGVEALEALAEKARLPATPQLYYVPSSALNAFAVGKPSDSAIAVTDGLIRALTKREFLGVLAHEVGHIAHRDLWVMGLADMLSRVTAVMGQIGFFLVLLGLPFALLGQPLIPLSSALLLFAAPTAMAFLQLALSRSREFAADVEAARLTGDPMGLASALDKLERRGGGLWEQIFMPQRRPAEPSLLRTHPTTEERIRRLRELTPAPEPRLQKMGDAAQPPLHARLIPRPRRYTWPDLWW